MNICSNYGDPEQESLNLDLYKIRMAETYLLRAEGYLEKGQKQLAADDINVVRERAKATPVTANDITLDYILDERARELSIEENRRKTLVRMNKFVERVRKYNPQDGDYIQDHHKYWPIPQSEIDLNSQGNLKQNKGY